MASIPLNCNVCPKRPEFSDLSHLLTHVASKGHLSHYFKVQVRSRQEIAAREQLDIYDRWYEQNQLEKLLSQRMMTKESKVANSRKRDAGKIISIPLKSRTARARPNQHTLIKEEDVLDPRLSQDQFQTRDCPLTRQSSSPLLDPASRHRAYVPLMREWPNPSQLRPRPSQEETRRNGIPMSVDSITSESNSEYDHLVEQSSLKSSYPEPPNATLLPLLPGSSSRSSIAKEGFDDVDTRCVIDFDAADIDVREANDKNGSIKLKGVHWPGMSIFDSASPEAQRKRNQKKDGSILHQMQSNSTSVEPMELIFTPNGNLKKERKISGMVESSPIQEESPKPKRRRSKLKQAVLSTVSTNVPRKRSRTGKSAAQGRTPEAKAFDLPKKAHAKLYSSSIADTRSEHRVIVPQNDDEVEWNLMLGELGQKKKRDIVIYDDDTEDERQQSTQLLDDNQKKRCYPFLQQQSSHQRTQSRGLTLLSQGLPALNPPSFPTSTLRAVAAHQFYPRSTASHESNRNNKENVEPVLDHLGRIDDEAARFGPDRRTQRYFSAHGANPPQFFDTMPPYLDFGAFARPGYSGTSSNPLNANCQQRYMRKYSRDSISSPPGSKVTLSPCRRPRESTFSGHGARDDASHKAEKDMRALFGNESDDYTV
ncbi:hypothetical protein MMC12_004178 [Toensbergia leucococca]|nr:hypothetical protein [Toensbergia leucococca]